MSPPQAPPAEAPAPAAAWWSSLPGILTALAGLVTAVAGLLTVLKSGPADPAPPAPAPVAQTPAGSAPVAQVPVVPAPAPTPAPALTVAPAASAISVGVRPAGSSRVLAAIRLSVEVRDPDGHSNLREGPGTQTPVIGRVDSGQRVTLLGRSGSWWKVRTADGREGYLHGSRLPDAPGS